MVKLVFLSGESKVRQWEIVIPVLGIIVLGYTLFRNIYPFPSGSAWWGPGTAVVWLAIGLIGAFVLPGAVRAGMMLMRAEGLAGPGAEAGSRLKRRPDRGAGPLTVLPSGGPGWPHWPGPVRPGQPWIARSSCVTTPTRSIG